ENVTMPLMPRVETSRLLLRPFTAEDLDDFSEILGKPGVMKYLGTDCQPMSRAETETALRSMIGHWRRHGFGRWAVVSKEGGRLIGCAGLRSYQAVAELVYLLDEPYWGRGLATEVARACLRFGFETQGFDRIVAFARLRNAASRRVLDKLGMSFDGETTVFGIHVAQHSLRREEFRPDHSAYEIK
ncbi:MAG TPA: GNAT family N-acetyltransferase, partial [Pyrinomonadaceae bacterium]